MAAKQDDITIRLKVDGQDYAVKLTLQPPTWGLTPREHGVIKRISGEAGAKLFAALGDMDPQTLVALAVIAMSRAGARPNEEALLDGVSTLELIAEEEPAVPPFEGVDADDAASASDSLTTPEGSGTP
ncbi:MAG: hypothetical protein H0X39_16870 [Actinobacteria bacterium]|nr:hypothetical protein [Actinomycetota bacterium]